MIRPRMRLNSSSELFGCSSLGQAGARFVMSRSRRAAHAFISPVACDPTDAIGWSVLNKFLFNPWSLVTVDGTRM